MIAVTNKMDMDEGVVFGTTISLEKFQGFQAEHKILENQKKVLKHKAELNQVVLYQNESKLDDLHTRMRYNHTQLMSAISNFKLSKEKLTKEQIRLIKLLENDYSGKDRQQDLDHIIEVEKDSLQVNLPEALWKHLQQMRDTHQLFLKHSQSSQECKREQLMLQSMQGETDDEIDKLLKMLETQMQMMPKQYIEEIVKLYKSYPSLASEVAAEIFILRQFKADFCSTKPASTFWNEIDRVFPLDKYTQLEEDVKTKASQIPPEVGKLSSECSEAIVLYTKNDPTVFKSLNGDIFRAKTEQLWQNLTQNWASFIFSLNKGLSDLHFFWGTAYRGRSRRPEDVGYKKGVKFGWLVFSSSSKNETKATGFFQHPGKNTLFIIQSSYGRWIQPFSYFPEEEELLFTGGSYFVVSKDPVEQEDVLLIEVEEIPFAYGEKVLVWIDDNPDNNKDIMEWAQQKGVVVIFLKDTTKLDNFLKDPNNLYLFTTFENEKYFKTASMRVITDMARNEDGQWDYYAGAKVVKMLREKGYKAEVMIYTSERNLQRGKEGMLKLFDQWGVSPANVVVTSEEIDVCPFATFSQ